jgi:hypothetical protein
LVILKFTYAETMGNFSRLGMLGLLLVGLARAEAADAALPVEIEARITRTLEEELRETQAPGAAVAILRDGELVCQDTFRTKDGQELAFVFKQGQTQARYLHMDLLTAIRSGK